MTRSEHSDERDRLERAGALHWVHWLVVALSLGLTLGAWYFSKSQLEAKVALQFEREADRAIALVLERMHKYEDALWSGVGMLAATRHEVSHETWLSFANSLRIDERYPGVNGIGVIEKVPKEHLPEFVEEQGRTRPGFRVHPAHTQAESLPIVLVEPVGGNRQAIGLDMAFESNRYEAAKKSRETGTAQLTGPITLVQDAEKTPGFLLFAPFYAGPVDTPASREERFRGMVYAPFIVNKLMNGVLGRESRHVGIRLVDGAEPLYDEHVASQAHFDPQPMFSRTTEVELYGRTWTFDIRSDRSFTAAASSSQPRTILIGGLAIDGLLLALFVLLSRSNRKAIGYADRANSELAAKARTLAKSNSDLNQLSHLVSHDLKAPLRNVKTLVSFIQDDCKQSLEPECQEHLVRMIGLVERMERLLEDLLSYSNAVNRGEGESCEEIPLEPLVDEICALNDLDRSAISLTGGDLSFRSEPFPIRTVLNNLLSNAFRHGCGASGACRIEFEGRRVHFGLILFSVRDFGPGIPEGREDAAFQMFKRLGSTGDGTGVGLAVVKRLVLNAGGEIWMEHPDGGGAKFVFTWPEIA
jgi:signal transduction histidine kinase